MPDRLLLLPPWAFSPRTLGLLPAGRALQAELASHFDLEVLNWPMIRGAERSGETRGAVVDAIQRALTPGCHVVAVGGSASSGLEAISRDGNRIASLTVEGIVLPGATLKAAGYDHLASLIEMALPLEKSWAHQVSRMILSGGGEKDIETHAQAVADDMDWDLTRKFSLSWNDWNMLEDPPHITVPTLVLGAPLPLAGYTETLEVLGRFAPDVEVGQLELWPSQNHLPEAGVELAEKISVFIDRTRATAT